MSINLKNNKNIALVGMPGCGKTTIGKLLAQSLGLNFVDADDCIEKHLGMKIKNYFTEFGESSFRQIEHEILSQLVGEKDILLSTGGGVVLNQLNRQLLIDNIFTIYLFAKPRVIFNRLKQDKKRPLLQSTQNRQQFIEQLFEQRDPLYQEVAKLTVESSDLNFYAIADDIAQLFLAEKNNE